MIRRHRATVLRAITCEGEIYVPLRWLWMGNQFGPAISSPGRWGGLVYRKINRRLPYAPVSAVAVLAGVLGAVAALRFGSSSLARDGHIPVLIHFPSWGIALLTVIVVAMVVFRILGESRLRLELNLLGAFLEHIPEYVYFKDRKSRFIRVNKAMAVHFGLGDPTEAIHKTDADMFSSEHADGALVDEQRIIETGEPIINIEEKETWPDGREDWVLTTKVPLKDRFNRVIGTMGISHNITERKEAEARIQYLALHDTLTGLPNRLVLIDRLGQAIALADRNQHHIAVLMLDLDRFKSVNDSYGHHVGDCVLELVAKRLRGCLRESDVVGRLGGDEFVICLPEMDGASGAAEVAEKVLSVLAEPFDVKSWHLHIGASIGICQYPNDGKTPEELLQGADAALYESKKKGRGTYCFFTQELTRAVLRRRRLEADLRQIRIKDELELHYQPLVSTDSGRITAVEALLRWHHPELGSISPGEFIPLLEDMGLMVEVGTWVLRTACMQNVQWQKDGLEPIRVAVNLSAQQFYRDDIVETVRGVLREAGLAPEWLELELTESLTLDDTEASITIMRELKQLGVSISLDDFGTGWSALSYLTRFPLDRIKIERSFLHEINSQSSAEAVVRSILDLGRNLGVDCVAEGVETPEQLTFLQKQRCAEIQGFLYSRALPPADCANLMTNTETRFAVAAMPI
jgi:diguanylate cyclase (GGDEF)-like protein/PAS domain S-box-containing protein